MTGPLVCCCMVDTMPQAQNQNEPPLILGGQGRSADALAGSAGFLFVTVFAAIVVALGVSLWR